ncbi:MAG: molybdopterin-dependent oxidoreductase [Micromonosporaceae bacterium]
MSYHRKTRLWGISAGVLAAATGLGLGQAAAAIIGGASPVIAVGNLVVDAAPGPVKDWAVRTLGAADKPVLLGTVVLVLAGIAAAVGVLGLRRRRAALTAAAILGLVGLAASLADTATGQPWLIRALPALASLAGSVGALYLLLRPLEPEAEAPAGFDRRRFLYTALAAGAVATTGGLLTWYPGSSAGENSRRAVRIPRPASSAPPIPSGAQLDVKGISRFVTSNRDFYRVDTALTVPELDAATWRLRVHGMVDRELDLSFADLLERRLIERDVTLTCVSNEVGGRLVGNARWIGVPVADLLKAAGVRAGADAVKSTSADGMTIGTPLDVLTDDREAMLAVAMNGEPLPLTHGFPVRMVTPGLYGYVSATKWLVDLEVTRFADFSAYWTDRGWAERAPIKTSSRIEVPKPLSEVAAGPVAVAGVAWAQTRGIERVEVQVDDGAWQRATLAAEHGVDTWRQWVWRWDATPGSHTLRVRATDGSGQTQTSRRAAPRPDGSSGWHSVVVRVK